MRIQSKLSITQLDELMLKEALFIRRSTDDPKGKISPQSSVGAIIVRDGKILSKSANVLPPQLKLNQPDDSAIVDEYSRYHLIEHAERAAIFAAALNKIDLAGATIYCTRFPCSDCARAIVWAGIKRAVFPGGFAGEQRWIESQRSALKIFRLAKVTVRYISV